MPLLIRGERLTAGVHLHVRKSACFLQQPMTAMQMRCSMVFAPWFYGVARILPRAKGSPDKMDVSCYGHGFTWDTGG